MTRAKRGRSEPVDGLLLLNKPAWKSEWKGKMTVPRSILVVWSRQEISANQHEYRQSVALAN